ncbi:MAG TPA: hypothetical protein ENM97_04375 [Moorella mulderi]|nr:hypothetical protein [Moorella mulderi]
MGCYGVASSPGAEGVVFFTMEGVPFLEKGKLYVPLRPLLTGMGIEEEEINYRAKEGSVEIAWQGKKYGSIRGCPM